MAALEYVNPVERHRLELGLDVIELAKRTGLDERTIYNVERGRVLEPSVNTLTRLAGVFQISPAVLINEVRAYHAQGERAA